MGFRQRLGPIVVLAVLFASPALSRGVARLADDLTFRPTVLIRQGTSQGSGTVLASTDGDTLILTAAHVVDKGETVTVEIHRYNMGVETSRPVEGWPRRVAGRVAARDPGADVALIRIRGMKALPFSARFTFDRDEPAGGTEVVSVGIDKGTDLNSWSSRVRGVVRLDMDRGGGDRPFLITSLPPEHGRSGGGLFRVADGSIVGVCVGRVEVSQGKRVGVFAATSSIRALLRDSGLEATVAAAQARRLRTPPAPIERTRRDAEK